VRRWIGWASRLYPAAWRRRYRTEFDALLDDSPLRWRDLADVLRGALIMRMTSWRTYGRAAAVAGVAGAIMAAAVSFALPNRYESQAVLRYVAPQDANVSQFQERLERAELRTLSRSALAEMIQEPSLDLYPKERQRAPVDDIAERMRTADIHVDVYSRPGEAVSATAFVIRFRYPDRYKAQAAVRQLVDRFQRALTTGQPGSVPEGTRLDLLESATMPNHPYSPNRVSIAVLGLLAGLPLGLLAALVWSRPKWSPWMAGLGAAGFVTAAAMALLIPNVWISRAVLRLDADTLIRLEKAEPEVLGRDNLVRLIQSPPLDLYRQQRYRVSIAVLGPLAGLSLGLLAALVWSRPKWSLWMAGFGVAGFVTAAAVALLIPNVWISRAVLRLDADTLSRLEKAEPEVLGRDNIVRLIQSPSLDLYRQRRSRMPIEDVAEQMRTRNISLRLYPAMGHGTRVLMISCSYPDPYKAQAVVRQLVGEFADRSAGVPAGGDSGFELLESATLPQTPTSPNRLVIATLGAVLGLILCLVLLRWRRMPAPSAVEPVPAA